MKLFSPEEINALFYNVRLSQNMKPDGLLYDQVNRKSNVCYLDDEDIDALDEGKIVIIQQCNAPKKKDQLSGLYYINKSDYGLFPNIRNKRSIGINYLKPLDPDKLKNLPFSRGVKFLNESSIDTKIRFRDGHKERFLITTHEMYLAKYHLLAADTSKTGPVMIPFSALQEPGKSGFKRHKNFSYFVNFEDCIPLSLEKLLNSEILPWETDNRQHLSETISFCSNAEAMFSKMKKYCIEKLEVLYLKDKEEERRIQVSDQIEILNTQFRKKEISLKEFQEKLSALST